MRIYNDSIEMVREVERDLFEMGIVVQPFTMQDKQVEKDSSYETLEIQAYSYMLTNTTIDELEEVVLYLRGNLEWVMEEYLDRISPDYRNPGTAWLKNASLWSEYIRDGQFAYTYNERFREQLPLIIRELSLRPSSRQAVMTMYDRHQDMNNWGGKDRVPCSMYYQFYIRNGKLNLIYTMRSCDFLTHFCHDVFLAISIQEFVANELSLERGNFTHFMGSLHAYRKDMTARGIF